MSSSMPMGWELDGKKRLCGKLTHVYPQVSLTKYSCFLLLGFAADTDCGHHSPDLLPLNVDLDQEVSKGLPAFQLGLRLF